MLHELWKKLNYQNNTVDFWSKSFGPKYTRSVFVANWHINARLLNVCSFNNIIELILRKSVAINLNERSSRSLRPQKGSLWDSGVFTNGDGKVK